MNLLGSHLVAYVSILGAGLSQLYTAWQAVSLALVFVLMSCWVQIYA